MVVTRNYKVHGITELQIRITQLINYNTLFSIYYKSTIEFMISLSDG